MWQNVLSAYDETEICMMMLDLFPWNMEYSYFMLEINFLPTQLRGNLCKIRLMFGWIHSDPIAI